ncbi:acetoin utilization protein AcuC [Thalassospira tepidiphila]|uniref:acetoin utilization protein AcuC n=1 Tax=Thalassospira tepidiphila TaxID=393657 RepID=UPI001BCE6089|nr:acetoin utilization protein AcuC [Thalassospira tepidiphila]MBS8272488.1 acetoin utilization protein AcuC [Thalassospira tepidiphila]
MKEHRETVNAFGTATKSVLRAIVILSDEIPDHRIADPAPRMIAAEIYRGSSYGPKHPLAIPRVSLVVDMVHALGWVDESTYLTGPVATPDQLARFHDPDYIAAVMQAERDQSLPLEMMERFGLGKNGNPIYPEIFRRPATAAGSSVMAANLIKDGGIIHHPAGGTHHGLKDRASGFCYFNDPVLGIYALLDSGLDRVLYVDIDAHHGDGVQYAFAEDERVLTVSMHQEDLWPKTGAIDNIAGGMARNLPVPGGMHDDEMRYVLFEYLIPLGLSFAPQAIVLQCGCDTLAEDPLSRQLLGNQSIWEVVGTMTRLAPRSLVLGGGGYSPYGVARCWSGVWATINGIEIPDVLPITAENILRVIKWSHSRGRQPASELFTTLADSWRGGAIRDEVRDRVKRLRGYGV